MPGTLYKHQSMSHLYRLINYQILTEDLISNSHCRWQWGQKPWLTWQYTHSHPRIKFVSHSIALFICLPMEWNSLASRFKIGLPKKAALKLKSERKVERRKATQWDPVRVENVYGEDSEEADWAEGQEGAWVLQRVAYRVEEEQQQRAAMMITANYTYWQGQ